MLRESKKKIFIFLCFTICIGCGISCSDSDDYEEHVFPTDNESLTFSRLEVSDITNVIFTYRNYLIEDREIKGKRYICISKDLGKTWKEFENQYGDIVYFHIYSTGDMLFSTKSWCYNIDSSLNKINPSQVYDYDGGEFVPVAVEHFFQIGDLKNYVWKLDDKEIHVWGDYSYAGKTDPKYVARVWYSTDFGKTVKCAIRFDQTQIDGKVKNCRHTHGVRFDKFEETFYVPTGDTDSESQLIKGKYDPYNDQWNFVRIGSGKNYKFSRIYFDENNAYLVTDYTGNNNQTGLIRCNKNYLHDKSHFEYVYVNPDNQALTCCEFDMNGNKIITPDLTGKDFIYYARDNYDFIKIPTTVKRVITGFTSPNYNGDVYARLGAQSYPFKLAYYFNFTQSMRNSGVRDYMAFKEQKSSFFDEDFFFTYR